MAEQNTNQALSEEERLKQMAAQMRAREYQGLSEEEIQERERQKEMRKKKNIAILEDTLAILEQGGYSKNGQDVQLDFSPEEMREIQAFLPEELASLTAMEPDEAASQSTDCTFACENEDALVLAQKQYQHLKSAGDPAPKILVLNLASATRPGGQTRNGASAQEEDLCRRTSLLLSLESEGAKRYYDYNNARKTRMGSDGVLLSPNVEVIKDASSETLAQPFPISVMSCAAPMVRLGLEGMSQQAYEEMLYKRIQGMLLVAASQGYHHLILGAFGCGVYGNDAALVSDLFARAIREFTFVGKDSGQLFDSIQFAVLCRPGKDYNYKEFCRNFFPD
ncbi:MAG: TIGR02452 family protein [Clostridiales bacterium]|nr:TIGR02452 family protein [Clostridiales bacterium]